MNDLLSASSPLGKRLIDEGFNPSGEHLSKDEALRWTISERHLDLLRWLITEGADVNAEDEDGNRPINNAVVRGYCEELRVLHEAGAAIDIVNRFKLTPLHDAAYGHNPETVRLLVNTFGVQIDPRDNNGWTPFVTAARHNNCETLKLLCDLGADVQVRDNTGNTALHHACLRGHVQAAELLVELGVGIDSVDQNFCTPLYHAAKHGQIETTRYLVETGADLSVKSSLGRTALHQAAWEGCGPVIDILLGSTCSDLEVKDNEGDTPLSLAAYCGNNVAVRLLVDKGATLQCQDNGGNSPLHNAIKGHSLEVMEFLVEKGARLEARNSRMETPLLSAARYGTVETIRLFERYKAEFHAGCSLGYSALHQAVLSRDQSLVHYFISYRLDLEEKTKHGQTALSLAAEVGATDIVALLLDSGADKETEETELGKEQWRPLHYTAFKGHKAVVELLLGEGADSFAWDKEGRIAEFYAIQENHLDVVELLRKKRLISQNTLQTSGSQPDAAFLRYMQAGTVHDVIEEGLGFDKCNVGGGRAVNKAAERRKDFVATKILEESAGADAQDTNGMTALCWACWHGNVDMVEELLLRGANAEVADNEGMTPLSVASLRGNDVIVKLLLEKGANPNSAVMYGKTPLLFAAAGQNALVVEHLVRAHANVSYKSPDDETALSIAKSYGHDEIIELLNRHQTQESEVLRPDVGTGEPPTPDERMRSDWLAEAAANGNIPEIRRLLENKVDVNSYSSGKPALIWAVEHKQLDTVVLLASNGANVDARDKNDSTALHCAARMGDTAIIELLCSLGSRLNSLDKEKRTPLSWAAESCDESAIKFLLDLGARLDIRDWNSRDPLWYAVYNKKALKAGELLLDAGANINSADKWGQTPLSRAVKNGNLGMSRFLLERGALMIPVSNTNSSPLCLAAESGREDIIELLIDYNANLDHIGECCQTPLIRAAQRGHGMVVKILLEMGARTDIEDDHGRTALSYVKEYGWKHIVVDICLAEYHRASSNKRGIRKAKRNELARRDLYEHRPLSRKGLIRILELHPGKVGDVISFDLYNVDLSKNPSFEALSYEWKERKGSVPVQCGSSRILVTPNCKDALESLRFETKNRALWIDAVCINQEDKQEVNEQVAMMTDIYRIASTVIMWLGKEDAYTEGAFLAFHSLENLHKSFPKTPGREDVTDRALRNQQRAELRAERRASIRKVTDEWNALELYEEEVISSLTQLYHASYFSRAWIFQEIILAGSRGQVRCGSNSDSWERVKCALLGFEDYMDGFEEYKNGFKYWKGRHNPCFQSIVAIDNDFKRLGGADITSTMAAMTTFEASDPRDKVFATLRLGTSLLTSRQLKPPVADYTKTTQQVYVEAARYYIHVCGRPGWDLGNRPSKKVISGLPSWVPDYAARSQPDGLRQLYHLKLAAFLSDFIPNPAPVSTTRSLHVSAHIMTHVVFKASITRETDIYETVRRMVDILADDGRGIYDARLLQRGAPRGPPELINDTIFGALLQCLSKLRLFSGDNEGSGSSGTDDTSDEESSQDDLGDEESKTSTSSTSSEWLEDQDIEWAALISWRLSKDRTTPELSRHAPPYLKEWADEWDKLGENSDEYLESYRELEDNLRYETDMVYTSKGSFATTSVGEAEEGMVIAHVAGQSRLCLLRRKYDEQEVWYEYVDDVYLSNFMEVPEMLERSVEDFRNKYEKIEIR